MKQTIRAPANRRSERNALMLADGLDLDPAELGGANLENGKHRHQQRKDERTINADP